MTSAQKCVVWGTGILLWVHLLSALLSAINFGYLDTVTLSHMVLILLPLLAIAALLLYVFKQPANSTSPRTSLHIRGTVTRRTS